VSVKDSQIDQGAKIKSLLEKQIEKLRAANEAAKMINDPETSVRITNQISEARQEIQRLLKEAEDARLNDPYYRRLRAAHPPAPAK
jgi:hypothetical protein